MRVLYVSLQPNDTDLPCKRDHSTVRGTAHHWRNGRSPKLQTVEVTPTAKAISVGQKQTFTATGTFSNGSKQTLGPAISNIALGRAHTCALLTSGGVECWGDNGLGATRGWQHVDSLVPRPVKGIATAKHCRLDSGHGCAVLTSGAVKCWGDEPMASWAMGPMAVQMSRCRSPGSPRPPRWLGVGAQLCAASQRRGAMLGWNTAGQLGDGTDAGFNRPGVGDRDQHGHCDRNRGGRCTVVRCWPAARCNAGGTINTASWAMAPHPGSNTPVTVSGISTATAVVVNGTVLVVHYWPAAR